MGYTQEMHGKNRFTRFFTDTATGSDTLVTAKTGYRCVVTGYSVSITHLAVGTCFVQLTDTAPNSGIGWVATATATAPAFVADSNSNMCLPFAASEGLSLSISGALTGRVCITIEGVYIPNNIPLSDRYTFAVP